MSILELSPRELLISIAAYIILALFFGGLFWVMINFGFQFIADVAVFIVGIFKHLFADIAAYSAGGFK